MAQPSTFWLHCGQKEANQPRFDEKNPDRVDKIIVCQKTQIAPSGNWIGGHATSSV